MPKSARAGDLIRRHITVPAIQTRAAEAWQRKNERKIAMHTAPKQITATSRKLKVSLVLDAAPFIGLAVPDGAPRVAVNVAVGGRTISASIAAKSLRRVCKTLQESGPDRRADPTTWWS
jgi:hypothetical protein